MEKLGLVLCGGGTKGAFQVGVWEALEDLGITEEITGFSGTSIGAVNVALLLSNANREKKEEIWKSFKQDDMTPPEKIKRAVNPKSHVEEVYNMFDIAINGFFSQEALEERLKELNLDYDEIKNSYDVFTSVTDLSVGHIHSAFIDWKRVPNQKIKRFIKYSAKLPILNGAHFSGKRLGHLIVDGGLRDFHKVLKPNLSNTPIAPLYAIGYRKFIVVYLSNKEKMEKQIQKENEMFLGSEICRIFDDSSSDNKFGSFIKIDEKITEERIKAGRDKINEIISNSPNNDLPFERTKPGNNENTISKTEKCIERGYKLVNEKRQSNL